MAQALGVPLEELLQRSLAAYVAQAKAAAAAEPAFEPMGFGMWADRPARQDAATWVADLRERAWTR